MAKCAEHLARALHQPGITYHVLSKQEGLLAFLRESGGGGHRALYPVTSDLKISSLKLHFQKSTNKGKEEAKSELSPYLNVPRIQETHKALPQVALNCCTPHLFCPNTLNTFKFNLHTREGGEGGGTEKGGRRGEREGWRRMPSFRHVSPPSV